MVVQAEDCGLGFIYWVASYPKSGNSWARAFLTSLITDGARTKSGKRPEIIPDENFGRFYKPFLQKPIEEVSNTELALLRPRVHRLLANKTQNFLLLKTHSRLGLHNGTPTITLDVTAGAIYLVRNPLDVAVVYSENRERGVDGTIAVMNESERQATRLKDRAYEIVGSWSEHVTSWTKPHDRILVLRHEDMLADPAAEFRRIVQFLKMDVSDGQLARALADTQSDAGSAGKWRDALSEEQVAMVVRNNEPVMKRFGYWLDEFDELMRRPVPSGATSP
jgi:hypothetical protein